MTSQRTKLRSGDWMNRDNDYDRPLRPDRPRAAADHNVQLIKLRKARREQRLEVRAAVSRVLVHAEDVVTE
ncbi:hypothetical protein [Streptomyces sp. NPDC046985]|uniref:hypothetical protein n=1 Tax=Streptomyces sp. NPDC046985 TaxID=3155377 RepID=UPI0033C6DBB0